MRAAVVVLMLIALAGCDRPEIKECRNRLMTKLKSPSSYKEVSAKSFPPAAGDSHNLQQVFINYDADNSYGASIRELEACYYPVENGEVNISADEDYWQDVAHNELMSELRRD